MKHFLSISLIFFILAGLLNSCKESPNDGMLKESKVEFAFSSGQIKSASEQGLTSIVISVEDQRGNTILNSEKIDIYHMNGRYISESVELVTGDYKLTRFLVLNGENDVVHATPIEGSDVAYMVDDPLPIDFYVSEDSVTEVTPQVVSVADSNPEDFGYVSFSFELADSLKIRMGAMVLDSSTLNYKLTNAHVEILSGTTLVYEGELSPYTLNMDSLNYDSLDLVNEINLPEAYNEFTIIVTKQGYGDYINSFSKEELRLYYRDEDNGPLIVTLDKVCQIPVGSADFTVYPQIQIWPDATVYFENGSIRDADKYIFDFGDGEVTDYTSFTTGFSHTYDSAGIYLIRLTLFKEGCISEATDSIVIGQSYAGDDQVVSSDTTSMNANNPYPGVGTWSLISGSGTIVNLNDSKSNVMELGVGENIFRWTVEYGEIELSDEVTITYNPQ